jgi:hypothetical protein
MSIKRNNDSVISNALVPLTKKAKNEIAVYAAKNRKVKYPNFLLTY